MSRIRLGIRFDPLLPTGGPGALERAERALLESAVLAEGLGLDAVWVAERPTQEGALIPAALPVCAALVALTERVRVATGLLPLPLHHPLRVAEDAATLDGLSGGRFELGVGLGADPEGFAQYGLPPEERAERFAEAMEVLRLAWRPGPVAFQGRHFQLPPTPVVPDPATPGGPPVWVGVRAPSLQRAAAESGAGLVLRCDDSPAPYLEVGAEEPRLAWLLPREADAEAARDRALALLDRSGECTIDLIFPLPQRDDGNGATERALTALAERVAPALKSPAKAAAGA